jgi:tetratricopeptide (TPR) repeat protein
LEVAHRACFGINEGDRALWLGWLRDESDNVIAACRTGINQTALLDQVLILLYSLTHPMWVIGRWQDWNALRTEALNSAMGQELSLHAQVLSRGAKIDGARAANDRDTAVRTATEFLDLVRANPEGDLLWAIAHRMVAECLELTDPVSAAEHYRSSTAWFVKAGYLRHTVWNHAELVRAAKRIGDMAEAERLRSEALELAERYGDRNSVAMYRKEFAFERLQLGEYAEAARLAKEASEMFEQLSETLTQVHALIVLTAAQIGLDQRSLAEHTLARTAALAPIADQIRQAQISHLSDCLVSGKGALDLTILVDV